MVYLIPNSIYKNVYAHRISENWCCVTLRKSEIIQIEKLFKNAMTSSAIMLLKKRQYVQSLEYRNIPEGKHIIINKADLSRKMDI